MQIKHCFWLLVILFMGCSGKDDSSFELPDLNYEDLFPYKENNLFGVFDVKNNKWVISPKYKGLQFIDDKRIALVDKGNKYAIITMSDEEIVKLSSNFWDAIKADSSLFIAREAGAGSIGPDLSYLIKIEDKTISVDKIQGVFISEVLKNEHGMVYLGRDTKENKALMYSPADKKIINDSYSDLKKVSNYLISGVFENKTFLMDYKGDRIMELDGAPTLEPGDSMIVVHSKKQGANIGLVNLKGEKTLNPVFDYMYKISPFIYKCEDKSNSAVFLFNSRDSLLWPVKDAFLNQSETYILAKTDRNGFVMDRNGSVVMNFSENQDIVPVLEKEFELDKPVIYYSIDEDEKKKYGVFQISDKQVVKQTEPLYDYIRSYSGGYTLANNSDNYFILDEKGKVVTNLGKKSWSYPGFEAFAGHFFINDYDKQFLLDKQGKEILLNKYDHLKLEYHKNYLAGLKGKQLDLYDKQLKKIASVAVNEVDASSYSITQDTLSGALIYSAGSDSYFIDIANNKLSRDFKIEKSFKDFHLVYFYEEEGPEFDKSYNGIVDNNGKYLLNPVYKSIVYEKELGLILAWKGKGVEVYDLNLNKVLDDPKIETYFISKELKLLHLSDEAETYSFYLDALGKKLVK